MSEKISLDSSDSTYYLYRPLMWIFQYKFIPIKYEYLIIHRI